MGKLIALAPKLPPAAAEKTFTEMALAALDEAREMILADEKAGQPTTYVVVAMGTEYMEGALDRMRTQWVSSGGTSDMEALGLLTVVGKDMFG